MQGLSVRVRGVVQGVGFRPFVFRLAERHRLTGWVRNTASQVEIEVDGDEEELAGFLSDLRRDLPPLARIDDVRADPRPPNGFGLFRILSSEVDGGWQSVPADTATCEECLRELLDPSDRRYRYPFTNCTHCGPRFTIIDGLPYDRARTTMRRFPMCDDCRSEYEDPRDRRFHAQPVACPACGPKLWLHIPGGTAPEGDAIAASAELLREGEILAIKGLGGFHLACDAANAEAVSTLRARKRRFGKPFAVMVPDLDWAGRISQLGAEEIGALGGRERPIVVAPRRKNAPLAPDVTGALDTVGVMLPYTPLHHLLLGDFAGPLVMTSGNLSEEPIAIGNAEALERLGGIADAFLLHDRDIYARYDDSVVRVQAGSVTPIRRARGFAPLPIPLPFTAREKILAYGAQQKNTFCLVEGSRAFLSQHIGDLDDLENLEHFTSSLAVFTNLFRIEPDLIVHDLHPDYMSTRLARDHPDEHAMRIGVQHHHAHVVACMAEHGLRGPVIGVAYDGTGYGSDGAIWGGEVLVADWARFRRAAHLRYVPMPGGEAAIRRPSRMVAGHVWAMDRTTRSDFEDFLGRLGEVERAVLWRQCETRFNTPMTSSCGRLFDAAAVLLGIRDEAVYEGQPAVELEAIADPDVDYAYPFEIEATQAGSVIDPGPALRAVWREHQAGISVPVIAGAFHNTVSAFTVAVCRSVRDREGLEQVVLSGGCFQNALLVDRLVEGLASAGFEVFTHRLVPPNDGGLALGQATIAHGLAADAV